MPRRPIIAFATSKGGAGKTTSLIILASVFEKKGGKVAVIDTDPANALWRWATKPGTPKNIFPYRASTAEEMLDAIDEAEQTCHLILIDVEGRASDLGTSAIAKASLVVIPVQPSEPDGVEASKTIRAVRAVERSIERPKKFCTVLNALPGAIRGRTFYDIVETFAKNDISIAAHLTNREIYKRMLMDGGTIYTIEDLTDRQRATAQKEAFEFADNIALLVGLRKEEGASRPTVEAAEGIIQASKEAVTQMRNRKRKKAS
ncbi:MAG: ParA family protein [Pseudomonadota bacterium]